MAVSIGFSWKAGLPHHPISDETSRCFGNTLKHRCLYIDFKTNRAWRWFAIPMKAGGAFPSFSDLIGESRLPLSTSQSNFLDACLLKITIRELFLIHHNGHNSYAFQLSMEQKVRRQKVTHLRKSLGHLIYVRRERRKGDS